MRDCSRRNPIKVRISGDNASPYACTARERMDITVFVNRNKHSLSGDDDITISVSLAEGGF